LAVTVDRATDVPGETQAPTPPRAPSAADFPVVPSPDIDAPRNLRVPSAGLAAALAAVVAAAAVLKWLSFGSIETAPLLLITTMAAAWWLDRRAGYAFALGGSLVWAAAAITRGALLPGLVNAALVAFGQIAVATLVAAARERDHAAKSEELRKEQSRAILALQLRESVVSIDVAVPLLADPLTLDRVQGAAYDQVRRHARGLSRLANDLLTLDQVDTRKMALTMVPVDLAAFVPELTEQRLPHDRSTIVAPSTPVQVHADPERLRQLLDHLLQNALKFSPPGAGVMVTVSATADDARVAVRDHGVGLSGEDMRVLFTRYGRIRDTRTANVPGLGLGLYLAKLIAEAHGGELLAASPGRGLGATFTVVLPLAGRPRRQRTERQLPASSFWD
jgi:signal transduction histidine kinase